MRFNASRKINLGNIDPLLQFEMEELSVHECDSPEEATQKLELWVKERIAYWRGVISILKARQSNAVGGGNTTAAPAPAPVMTSPPPAHYVPGQPTSPVQGGPPPEFG